RLAHPRRGPVRGLILYPVSMARKPLRAAPHLGHERLRSTLLVQAPTTMCGLIPTLSVRHSGRAAAAARAGIHNHRQWLWIPGSRASPAPRNDESEFTRVGLRRRIAYPPRRTGGGIFRRPFPSQMCFADLVAVEHGLSAQLGSAFCQSYLPTPCTSRN